MSVADWPIETWIGLGTFIGGTAAAVATAVFHARRGHEDDDDDHYGPKPVQVKLADEDRGWLTRLAIEVRDALDDHRKAIKAQTEELERGRRDCGD